MISIAMRLFDLDLAAFDLDFAAYDLDLAAYDLDFDPSHRPLSGLPQHYHMTSADLPPC